MTGDKWSRWEELNTPSAENESAARTLSYTGVYDRHFRERVLKSTLRADVARTFPEEDKVAKGALYDRDQTVAKKRSFAGAITE